MVFFSFFQELVFEFFGCFYQGDVDGIYKFFSFVYLDEGRGSCVFYD